jgi:putative ABC transport system substrate-binding protein
VGSGLVASLARPGGNVTGLSTLYTELSGKQLQMLKEAVPEASRVAFLCNPENPAMGPGLNGAQATARALAVQLQVFEVRRPNELEKAFSAMARDRVGALLTLPDALFSNERVQLLKLATKSRLPAIFSPRDFVEAGGLMSYGPNVPNQFRRAANYVDRILKGANPADLPIEQPTTFELVINLKTAKALGLTIPQSVLIRADEVIQ